jgi:HD-GYP domain-containing protein (c-di-GMP phosphodiesterase class II)
VAIRLGLADEPERLEALTLAALLHDIGVIGVPDTILAKPGPLEDPEFTAMAEHAAIGESLLLASGLTDLAGWVRHHHERVDGTGYPDGLEGDDIPLESRIIGVVEALEAMTAARYVRPREGTALDELELHAGTQFDVDVAGALIDLLGSDGGRMELLAVRTPGAVRSPSTLTNRFARRPSNSV